MMATNVVASFLVGLAAGKLRIFADVTKHNRALSLVQWVGYSVGLAGAVVFATFGRSYCSGGGPLFALAINILTAPLLTAAYVTTLLRLFHSDLGRWIAQSLAPTGRMALSNYLGQSLTGRVSSLTALFIAIAIFLAQLVLSTQWMANHRYGPVSGTCVLLLTLNGQPGGITTNPFMGFL
jgi:uncharacterized protein